MSRAVQAGIAYFAVIFAFGFVLGAVRVTIVAPKVGEIYAVLIELPFMLAAAWTVCGWLAGRFSVPDRLGARSAMGGTAFVLLMIVEVAFAKLAFGRSLAAQLASYGTLAGIIGLGGQIAFAIFPLARRPHN